MTIYRFRCFTTGALAAIALLGILTGAACSKKQAVSYREVLPERGDIRKFIGTTGTVEPRNRLEIKPTIAGRVESVLVTEGQTVRKGQLLAWMSSTERAALIDAARMQGDAELGYWENAYKPTPIIAPITGTVIVRDVEPGQTVAVTNAVLVLADRLVVTADVDETDIGNVRLGMEAELGLDSYPDVKVNGRIHHISYESTVVNNVTMYKVQIIPDRVPAVFRSGMSASINIIQAVHRDVLLLPIEAVTLDGGINYVLLDRGGKSPPVRRAVKTGLTDETRIEIVEGLSGDERVLVANGGQAELSGAPTEKKNPFVPTPMGRQRAR
ncbi:MAG TPA: efflux RND transporter periplasmic adaptor subunit [Spirochaetota bacterium]|nr:MAG: Cobalt-zinc-cadmium resistance protein CzcB [Spirochaetes bacterium ADurb.BinA120]HNU91930.1 efflux RND transporter periplasmic adaptor subunit [Spirochaetota bacterium]HPO46062.1 efflux RND transporter periplasmic adaptor subunit [Spirochaetota bacterium]